jgi:hypothetical protein
MTTKIVNPNIKFFTYKKNVPLNGGTLAFAPGRGYYAKPAATNPYAAPPRPAATPPVNPMAALTPAQIDANAGKLAQSVIDPQKAEIDRQRGIAQQRAKSDYAAITGFQTAAAGLMAQLGPEAQAAYERAANTEGQLGQGLATGAANDVAAGVASDKAFMDLHGQSGGPGPDTAALHDTLYSLNGRIPGDTFAEQGANAAKWGLAQAPIALNAGREELDARMYAARQEDDQYAQQLIQLAATYPAEKEKALQQLNQYELDKANYRLNQWQTHQQIAISKRSELAQEKAAGLTADYHKQEMKYKFASLKFQSHKAMAAAKAATAKGKTIDVQASKLLGHIVYKDGTEDKTIKVAQSGTNTPGGITAAKKVAAKTKAVTGAYEYATKLLGDPVKAKGGKGRYVARTSGVPLRATFPTIFPGGPRTTNNPKYAQREGGASGWQDAFSKTWAEIGGDVLVQDYGYTREQVTAWVRDALRRAGWKRK